MASTKIAFSNPLNFVLTAAVASGDVVVAGSIVGVAETSGEIGDTIALDTEGVHRLTKTDSAHTYTVGAKVYATSAGAITSTASGNKLIGYAVAASANGDTTVDVRLIPAG